MVWSVLSAGVLFWAVFVWWMLMDWCCASRYRTLSRGRGRGPERKCLISFSLGSFIAVVLDGHKQCRWSFTAKADYIKGSFIWKTAHFSVTLLFCRFKILWLTLCQLHNEFEIEVSLSCVVFWDLLKSVWEMCVCAELVCMRGLQWFLTSVGYHFNLINSDSYRLPVWISMWLKKKSNI